MMAASMALSMDSISWDDLQLVLVLAREGSLLGAGRVMGLNASTVGRRLEALESRLELRIFDRTRQGVLMTAVAEQMLPFAESAEQAAADFLRVAEGFEREVAGLVRLSAPPGAASLLLAAWAREWLDAHPGLRIQIDAEVGYADLSRRETDLALRVHRPESGDLVAVKLVESEICVVASPSYVEKCGEVSSLERLRWISWGPKLSHIPGAKWLRSQVPEEQIALCSDSIEVQVQACKGGLGVMLMAAPLAALAGLVPLPLTASLAAELPPFPVGTLWLVCHRALRHVPRIAAIWEALLAKVAETRSA